MSLYGMMRTGASGMNAQCTAFVALLVLLVLFRIWLALNLPLIVLHDAALDDGLFIQLGRALADWQWLGPYDQRTLMKGPVYSGFLALNAWSGLPVSLSHAIVQIGAIAVAAYGLRRLTGSTALATATFVLLLFNPAGLFLDRIVRDQIYWPLSLVAVTLILLSFLSPERPRRRFALAVGGGLTFGLFWLTREEGILMVPALMVGALGTAIVVGWKGSRERLLPLIVAVLACVGVVTSFGVGNRIAYGSYVGIDFKDAGFAATLDLLQSIEAGPPIPFVPVTNEALAAAAQVSPTLAPVLAHLEPGGLHFRWEIVSCEVYPISCGQVGGGWFMWALRDAAAEEGFYESPDVASRRFAAGATELRQACDDGHLSCKPAILSYMPSLSRAQLSALPALMTAVVAQTAFVSGALRPTATRHSDTSEAFEAWSFLNRPLITEFDTLRTVRVSGWFFDPESNAWPTFELVQRNGSRHRLDVPPIASPDVASVFGAKAAQNRFELSGECFAAPCRIETIRQGDENPVAFPLDEDAPPSGLTGTARYHLDNVIITPRPVIVPAAAQSAAASIRDSIFTLYSWISLPVFAFGVLAFAGAAMRAGLRRRIDAVFVAASLFWCAIVLRTLALALIEVTSFPAVSILYAAPIAYWLWLASAFSIATWFPDCANARV